MLRVKMDADVLLKALQTAKKSEDVYKVAFETVMHCNETFVQSARRSLSVTLAKSASVISPKE